MDLSPTLLIVLGLVCILLGYVACVLVNTLREESQAASAVDEAPPGGKRGGYSPITRLWRAKKAGNLVVEINGKAFVSSSALNADERTELEQSERDLRAWLGMGWQAIPPEPVSAAGQGVAAAAPSQKAAAPSQMAGPSEIASEMAGAPQVAAPLEMAAPSEKAPSQMAAPSRTATVPAPASSSPAKRSAPAAPAAAAAAATPAPSTASAPVVETPAASSSIVTQIDDILQDMLAVSPLASRGIRLAEDPASGVVVFIGAQRYPGIDAVPDPEAKAMIQRAVHEWEASQ
jgi:hypothetical protein